jgi:hypothetical protein
MSLLNFLIGKDASIFVERNSVNANSCLEHPINKYLCRSNRKIFKHYEKVSDSKQSEVSYTVLLTSSSDLFMC